MNTIHEGLIPAEFKKPVEYIGTEEQQDEVQMDEEGEPEEEPYGVFDEENPGEAPQEPNTYQVITETFDGTEVPEGAIPHGATDIEITTTTESVDEQVE